MPGFRALFFFKNLTQVDLKHYVCLQGIRFSILNFGSIISNNAVNATLRLPRRCLSNMSPLSVCVYFPDAQIVNAATSYFLVII
jgi:hypothetical protein